MIGLVRLHHLSGFTSTHPRFSLSKYGLAVNKSYKM